MMASLSVETVTVAVPVLTKFKVIPSIRSEILFVSLSIHPEEG